MFSKSAFIIVNGLLKSFLAAVFSDIFYLLDYSSNPLPIIELISYDPLTSDSITSSSGLVDFYFIITLYFFIFFTPNSFKY